MSADLGYLAHRREALQKLLGIVGVHGSIYDPRSDGVEPYALLRVFHGEAPRDRFEPALSNHDERSVNARNRMLHHRRGNTGDAAAGLLQQHLLDGQAA